MQVVKALYREGNIQLLSPLTDIKQAELLVIVLDQEGEPGLPEATSMPADSEQDFKALGMASFFDTDEDQQIDWEEVFDVKSR